MCNQLTVIWLSPSLTTEVNHHLCYTALHLCNNVPCVAFFLSLAGSQNEKRVAGKLDTHSTLENYTLREPDTTTITACVSLSFPPYLTFSPSLSLSLALCFPLVTMLVEALLLSLAAQSRKPL